MQVWVNFRRKTMPELFEIMESCRAMRRLKPDPVPDELIAKILRAGIYAPKYAVAATCAESLLGTCEAL